jgi:hypothetical protein
MTEVAHLIKAFERYEKTGNVIGVALGHKSPGDRTSTPAITFMVRKKLPRRGSRRTLSDGAVLLPKTTIFGKRRVLTDVIESDPGRNKLVRKQQGAQFTSGCQISNRTSSGTMGALMRRAGDQALYALTNRHVAIGTGNYVFVPVPLTGAVAARVQFDLDVVDDNLVLPFLNSATAYVDVDAALAAIPAGAIPRFSPTIPTLGRPTGFFQANYSSSDAYRDSLVGTDVAAYSWNTGVRRGIVSHVLYATRARRGNAIILYTHLIEGTNGVIPGESRDSGKVWVTAGDAEGEVELVALHQGVVRPSGEGSQYAVATDCLALSRLLNAIPA